MSDRAVYQKLFSILDDVHELMIIFNEKGKIVGVNQEFVRKVKIPKAKIIGEKLTRFLPPIHRKDVLLFLDKPGYKGRTVFIDEDGKEFVQDILVKEDKIDETRIFYLHGKDVPQSINEEKLLKVFDENPLPMSLTSITNGKIIKVNKNYSKFFNSDPEDLIGKTTLELGFYVKESDRKMMLDEFKKNNDKLVNYSIDLNTKTGIKNTSVFLENTEYNGEKVLLAAIIDMTDEKIRTQLIEDSLKRQQLVAEVASKVSTNEKIEIKIESVISLINSYISICDIYIFEFDKSAYTFFSHKNQRVSIPEVDIKDFDLDALKNEIINKHQFTFESKSKILKYYKLINPFKSNSVYVFPIKVGGNIIGFVGYSKCVKYGEWDIQTIGVLNVLGDLISNIFEIEFEKNELQKKIIESDNSKKAMMNVLEDVEAEEFKNEKLAKELIKFELAVNQSSDQIVMTDVEGNIVYANQAVENITGYKPSEVIGLKPGDLWGGQMGPEFYTNFWKQLSVNKKMFKGEFSNKKKTGEMYIAESTVIPILDDNGEVNFYMGVERDITKAKEIDRMKSEFISIASHQLRTPLSAMKWYLEMILNGDAGKLTPQLKDFIQNINSSNERMIDLVNSLLNVSRIESGRLIIEPKPTEINKLISDIKSEIDVKVREKDMKLLISIEDKLPKIVLDGRLIRNVIMNLLTNAIKYSPVKTSININIKKDDTDFLFEVIDHGYGIPKTDTDKVFTKFYRGSNIVKFVTDGNGIGLYLVKAIIEASGGQIGFNSIINKGTTFWFKLPIKGVSPKKGEVILEDTF
jgi:PAS domain S-box-containing protein